MQNGRVYVQKAYEIPEGSRTSKGRKIFILEEFIDDESIPMAYCCVAFCYAVPTNEEELEK